ncbi:hypothetical protein RUND412_011316, partial [Rhizina undulata]
TKRPPGSPIRILEVPAGALKRCCVEILVAPLSAGAKDLIMLQATKISGARIIQYPVHKILVYAGEGAKGLQTLLEVICKALSFPGIPTELNTGNVKIIDLPLAEDTLKKYKASTADAPVYEKECLRAEWNYSDNGSLPEPRSPMALLNEEKSIKAILPTPPSELTTAAADDLETLSEAVADWSLAAHTELRDTLDAAFKSNTWRKLAWWKLLWAIETREIFFPRTWRSSLLRRIRPRHKKAQPAGAGFDRHDYVPKELGTYGGEAEENKDKEIVVEPGVESEIDGEEDREIGAGEGDLDN